MDSQSPSQLLERQHRQIDEGIEAAAQGTGTIEALAASLALLRQHLYLEEEVLFPPLEEAHAGLAMSIFVMQREHGQMWPLLESLEAACKTGSAIEPLQDDCSELLTLLQMHNPKEERILYTMADQVAGGDDGNSLLQDLATARMPEDWACAMGQG